MGQKVSPVGFRTGVTIGWKSRWFAPKSNYGEFLVEDEKIRRYIDAELNRKPPYAAISDVEIERTREEVKILLKTARPGLVIGPKGAEVEKLKVALENLTNRRVNINIVEIRNPDLDARLVAEGIAEQLKRRGSFRRSIKQRIEASMQAGAKGIKVMVSGRLMGNEIARSEKQLVGSIPLHTLEADVDYGFATSFTAYGTIGVKVWIYRGMYGEQPAEEDQTAAQAMTRARRRREGHGGEGRGGARGGRSSDRGGRGRSGQGAEAVPSGPRPGGSRLGGRGRAEATRKAAEASQAAEAPPAAEVPPAGEAPPVGEASPAGADEQAQG